MCIATSAERPSAQLSFFRHQHQNCGCGEHHWASALASSLHGMGDCARHQCVVISAHRVLPMTCWLLWLYDQAAVRLSAPGLLRNWQIWYNYPRYSQSDGVGVSPQVNNLWDGMFWMP